MLKSVSSFILLLGFLFAFSSCAESKQCVEIQSWKECEQAPHCTPVRLFVSKDHKGPIWHCDPKPKKK